MSDHWLQELEQNLDSKLERFLRSNPYQDFLLNEQSQRDQGYELMRKELQIKDAANKLRKELIELAKQIKLWKERSKRAEKYGAHSLAIKADKHIQNLISEGEKIWSNLKQLGDNLRDIERQSITLNEVSSSTSSTIEKEWRDFEAQQELDDLKQKKAN